MARVFMVIKGDRLDASREAKLRGINIEIDTESENTREVYCYAPQEDKGRVIEWFCAGGQMGPAYRGECLWYTVRD